MTAAIQTMSTQSARPGGSMVMVTVQMGLQADVSPGDKLMLAYNIAGLSVPADMEGHGVLNGNWVQQHDEA